MNIRLKRFGIVITLLVATLFAGCAHIPDAPSGTKTETLFLDHKDKNGNPIKLEFELHLPPGNGPFDIVLYSHGGPPPNNRGFVTKAYDMAGPFLKRNIAVASIMRQGRWKSGGSPSLPRCRMDQGIASVEEGVGDTEVGLSFIKQSPLFAGKKVYMTGTSQGGLMTMILASRHPETINKAFAFASGWYATGFNATDCIPFVQNFQNKMFEDVAKRTAAPTLFLYASNDSYFPPNSVTEAFGKYKAKGGTGVLKTYPDVIHLHGDGHYMFRSPEIWEKDVMEFLGLEK